MKLVKTIKIKDPIIEIKNDLGCYLYDFNGGGMSLLLFKKWLDGRIMDIWDFGNIKIRNTKKCPWCESKKDSQDILMQHIKQHGKTEQDLITLKLCNLTYTLLLKYIRNSHYDALSFLIKGSCQFCIKPNVKGREGKCAIPLSSRNKIRSLEVLNFSCKNFNIKKYNSSSVAIIYKP